MPRNYKPVIGKTRRKQYPEARKNEAIEAVAAGMSQTEASATYDISQTTLSDALRGVHTRKSGGQTALTAEEENILARNIAILSY